MINFDDLAVIIFLSIMIIFGIYVSDDKKFKVKQLLNDKLFIVSTLITFIIVLYIKFFLNKNKFKKLNIAINNGIIAFIIAICAHIDLKVVPFWIVALTSYFFQIG